MNLVGKTGPYIIAIVACIPIYFWLPFASFINLTAVLRSMGQVTALVGTALICINFILTTRLRFIEALFSGLNRVYIVHAYVGAIGFIFVLLHPTGILLSYVNVSLSAAVDLLTPSIANLPTFVGITALVTMMVLMILTLYVKFDYDLWKKTHQYLGLVLLLSAIHALLIGSTMATSQPLRLYMMCLFITAGISFCYTLFAKRLGVYRHQFLLEKITISKEASELTLRPKNHMFHFVPGQFAFISVHHRGLPKDSHPFSITSAPDSPLLSFAVKSLGDYTETIKLLEPGTPIDVEGPFGRFSYHYYKNINQLWIAGGIGVTPFISMLRSLPKTHGYFLTFIYCVKDRTELLFYEELHTMQTTLPNLHLHIWVSSELGRLTADVIAGLMTNVEKQEVFICGPPIMMKSLRHGLGKRNIRNSHIHTEEFSLNT